MKKVTFLDLEWANNKNKSICQIALICEDLETGEDIYPKLSLYVNPKDFFDLNCVKIHGITSQKVKEAPTFDLVWKEIEKYFMDTIIIGHNVACADLDAIIKNLSRYKVEIPEIHYVDTMKLTEKCIPRYLIKDYKLTTISNYYNIVINNHHDAFDDTITCRNIFRKLIETFNCDVLKEVKLYNFKKEHQFISYISNSVLRKSINDFYGVLCGITIDSIIKDDEAKYIYKWRKDFMPYIEYDEINAIINIIDTILSDNIITIDEALELKELVKKYLDIVNTSPITLSI